MRIQHNIMAMSAYRNYNTNTSALAKNLEKLSSGYKINRAGDDAAGLAISEKMRAQITGLNAAQKNVKDGISLVKTAEGAMQEIQDMLNRMDYLATQSANGTYQNEVDREALQKEVNQLLSEIDRIADSSNFNGIKLLDGSLDSTEKVTVNAPSFSNQQPIELSKVDGSKKAVQVHEDSTGSAKTSFEVNLEGLAYKVTDGDGKALANKDIGKQTFKLSGLKDDGSFGDLVGSIEYNVSSDSEGKITGADIAKAIADVGKITMTYDNGGDATKKVEIEYNVTLGEDGQTLKFEMSDKGYADAVAASKDTDKVANVKNQNIFAGHYNFVAQNLEAKGADGTAITDGSVNLTEDVTAPGYATMQDTSTSKVVNGNPSAGAIRGEAVIDFDALSLEIKDGAGLKVGDQYYVWGGSDETVNAQYGDNVKVVDIRDLVKKEDNTLNEAADATADSGTHTDRSEALSRLTVAAADNKMFNVQHNNLGTALVFTERETNTNSEPLKTYEGFQGELQSFDAIKANVDKQAAPGKSMTLQIGDTADDYNQLKVSIGDMHTKALGVGNLDISTPETAAAAIQTIKDAINQVSSVRGDLGAYQNRLEHTANNLSVMAENITDAESTIRDTDIAEEMMSYTKNNILIQSAQAMLAQANAVPQGVLQLLG